LNNNQIISENFASFEKTLKLFFDECSGQISHIADELIATFNRGGKVLICGNGGSAADSQHFAAELVSSFSHDINRPSLPAIALTTDSSVLTAYANDFSFEGVFSRQIESLGDKKDVLIAFSTSGSSKNCISAINTANNKGMTSICFTKNDSKLSNLTNLSLSVPSRNTQEIQQCHMVAYHLIVEIVEKSLFGKGI